MMNLNTLESTRRMLVVAVLLAGVAAAAARGQTATQPAAPPQPRQPNAAETGMEALRLYKAKDYREAARYAARALEIRRDQAQGLLITGMCLILDNRGRDAIEYLRRYTESAVGRNDYMGYEGLGDIAMKSNYPRMAQENFISALPLAPAREGDDPVRARIQMKLAESLSLLGKMTESVEMAKTAVKDVPASAEFQWKLARILASAKSINEAIAAMNNAVRLLNEELQASFSKALMDPKAPGLLDKFQLLNQIYDALQRATREQIDVAKGADAARLYGTLARTMTEQADVERQIRLHYALDVANEAVRADRQNPDHLVLLAERQFAVGRRAAALVSLEAALKLDPKNAKALAARAKIMTPSASPTSAPAK